MEWSPGAKVTRSSSNGTIGSTRIGPTSGSKRGRSARDARRLCWAPSRTITTPPSITFMLLYEPMVNCTAASPAGS